MKTPFGTDLRADHIALDGFPALREKGTAPPPFRPMSIVATVAHLSSCHYYLRQGYVIVVVCLSVSNFAQENFQTDLH